MEAEVACLERRERLEVEEEDLAIEETQGLVRSRIEEDLAIGVGQDIHCCWILE